MAVSNASRAARWLAPLGIERIDAALMRRLVQYAWGFAAPACAVVFSVLTSAIASRVLGPSGFGQFAVATTTVALLITVMELGMPVTLVRFAAQLPEHEKSRVDQYRAAAWALMLLVCALAAVALIVANALAPERLSTWIPAGAAIAIAIAGFGTSLVDLGAAEAQVNLRFQTYFWRYIGGAAFRLMGVAGALFLWERTATAAVMGYAVAMLASGLIVGRRGLATLVHALIHDRASINAPARALLRFTLPVVGAAIVVATYSNLDVLVVAAIALPAKLGSYTAAVRLLAAQTTLIAGLSTLAVPLASRAHANGRSDQFTTRVLWIGGGLGVAVTTAVVLLSPFLVHLVFGSRYPETPLVFAILSAGLLVNFVANPLSYVLYAAGMTTFMFGVQVAQLIFFVAGFAPVAHRWGIVGVAAYRSIVNTLVTLVVIVRVFQIVRAGNTSVRPVIVDPEIDPVVASA